MASNNQPPAPTPASTGSAPTTALTRGAANLAKHLFPNVPILGAITPGQRLLAKVLDADLSRKRRAAPTAAPTAPALPPTPLPIPMPPGAPQRPLYGAVLVTKLGDAWEALTDTVALALETLGPSIEVKDGDDILVPFLGPCKLGAVIGAVTSVLRARDKAAAERRRALAQEEQQEQEHAQEKEETKSEA